MERAHPVTAPQLIDAALASRALVYGSLPPEGRDLDLLVRPPDDAQMADRLRDSGFLRRGSTWARFTRCTVELVELTPAAAWRLPEEEVDALFEQAWPLDGFARLVRPAPHHLLLILARRTAGEGGGLDGRRRARIRRALDEDPDAWAHAHRSAPAWDAEEPLQRLHELERLEDVVDGGAPRRARTRSRGGVIALSGLDGAGKSTQAIALRDTLERLGYDATVVWTRIAWDDALWRLALPVKAALQRPLRLLASQRAPSGSHVAVDAASTSEGEADDPVKRLREGSRLATHAWTLVIALTNALSQRRLTRAAYWRGRVVICDRYTLDSIVALRHSYGPRRRFRLQRALIAALSPTPRRAYLLDVRPETAFARKGEGGVEWLAEHRRLYLEEHVDVGVRMLDGERPADELCAEIASDVWQSGL